MSLEQEIKLKITGSAPDLTALEWLSALTNQTAQQHLRTDYYDSTDFMLKQAGLALRIRQVDQAWRQTVKSQGRVVDGLHQRDEWEVDIADEQFDLSALKQTPLKPFVEDAERWPQLKRLFTTEFDRQIWHLIIDETEVELAYDFGEVRTDADRSDIHEIELELLAGDVNVMRQVAERLKTELNLDYHDESKAAAGYRLLTG